jgi:hypothetical protein
MKREFWGKAVESMGLVVGYFWYNADLHMVVTRVLR